MNTAAYFALVIIVVGSFLMMITNTGDGDE